MCIVYVHQIWGTEATGVEEEILAEIPFAAKIGEDIFTHFSRYQKLKIIVAIL